VKACSPRDRFFLSKWYLDAVSESGEVFIGYRGALRWRTLEVSYAATLATGANGAGTRSAATIRPGSEPLLLEGDLAWREPKLDVSASWHGAAQPISRTLHESPRGAVVWRCLLPSATASIDRGGTVSRGRGYAEHLSMTIPPWRLPLDTLRWGRFLTEERSVVWIDWESREGRRTWVFVDGTESVDARVSDDEIAFGDGRVILPADGRLTLRHGTLGSGALSGLSSRWRLPARVLASRETKWRTRALLDAGAGAREAGWAIHEVVRMAS
jgi:hypothetical protein